MKVVILSREAPEDVIVASLLRPTDAFYVEDGWPEFNRLLSFDNVYFFGTFHPPEYVSSVKNQIVVSSTLGVIAKQKYPKATRKSWISLTFEGIDGELLPIEADNLEVNAETEKMLRGYQKLFGKRENPVMDIVNHISFIGTKAFKEELITTGTSRVFEDYLPLTYKGTFDKKEALFLPMIPENVRDVLRDLAEHFPLIVAFEERRDDFQVKIYSSNYGYYAPNKFEGTGNFRYFSGFFSKEKMRELTQ